MQLIKLCQVYQLLWPKSFFLFFPSFSPFQCVKAFFFFFCFIQSSSIIFILFMKRIKSNPLAQEDWDNLSTFKRIPLRRKESGKRKGYPLGCSWSYSASWAFMILMLQLKQDVKILSSGLFRFLVVSLIIDKNHVLVYSRLDVWDMIEFHSI